MTRWPSSWVPPLAVRVCQRRCEKIISGRCWNINGAESAAALRGILGEERLRHRGMVQAHGTGTPQNRVTESALLSKVAKAFGVSEWPVAAIKSYVGHSLGAAAGDQLTATLGIWQHGVIPEINTVDSLAEDVVTECLSFALKKRSAEELDYALINSKGFGGTRDGRC